MSLSAQSAIQQALLLLGVYDPGETPSTSEQNDLLLVLNNMLDNFSQERANIPVVVVASASLVSGTSAYTFGPAGTFGTRYIRLDNAGTLIPSAAITGTFTRDPIQIVSQAEFQSIVEKTALGQRIERLYYDYQFPTATANVWPTPNFSGTAPKLEVSGWQALANFPDLTTVVNTPQGYDRGIVFNLAVECASQYPGIATISPNVLRIAEEAKAAWRQLNINPVGVPASGLTSAVAEQQPPPPAAGAAAPVTP